MRKVAVLLVAVIGGTLLAGQTPSKRGKKSSKPVPAVNADSIAQAYQDSVRRSLQAKAAADSAKRYADSLASRADSVKTVTFRKVRNNAFGVGERLVFDVNYGFITAGEAVMVIPSYETVAGRKCFRIEFHVNSLPFFSTFFKVEDRYLTFLDEEAIAPWKFEQHIREGTYKRDFIAEFDHVKNLAVTTEGTYPVPEYVHDIMSSFYYYRTFDFADKKIGDQMMLYNFYKDKSYDLRVKFLGRQELEVEAGTFKTIVVEPLVKEGGLFKSEGRIVIWLTDDERKMPVRVNTKVVIGSIDVELREYSGLIGPVTARVK